MQENAMETQEKPTDEGTESYFMSSVNAPDAGFSASTYWKAKRAEILLILLVLADTVFTIWAISTGKFSEQNPIAKNILELGVLAFILAKISSLGFFLWASEKLPQVYKTTMHIILLSAYSLILTLNVGTLLQVVTHG